MQTAFSLESSAQGFPGQTGLLRHVTQRQHHTFFHTLEATHIEAGIWVGQQTRQIGGALAHHILHIAFGLARCAREGKVDVDEVFGQVLQRAEVGQLFLGARAKEQHQLATLKFA